MQTHDTVQTEMKRTSMSKCQINRHTNCRFSVIRTRNQSIPKMLFSSEMQASTQYQRTVPVLFQSGSARTRNCNEKNQLNIRLSIHFQSADRLFVQFCRFWLWRDVLIDITMISRQDVWQCVMYANHVHATYVACGGWRRVVHIHAYIDHDASLSTNIHWVYIHLHWRCLPLLLPCLKQCCVFGMSNDVENACLNAYCVSASPITFS